MSDSETTPEVNTGDVEGDVNVNPPAEDKPAEETDDNASATDDASVDTGALQE